MRSVLRPILVFTLLLGVKIFARLFYRIDMRFIGTPPPRPWHHLRLLAFLNHTSLFEPLFAGGAPISFLWRLARHGVVPIAIKTSDRAVVGNFYRLIASRVVPISRERDETWEQLLNHIDTDAMVAILPEGRMMRSTGLDKEGRPMTVRGGIADILESLGRGKMLLAYSGGLHHVQIPGERFPRLWKTIRMRMEVLEIEEYRASLVEQAGSSGFKRAVIADLERRRDLYKPPETA